MNTEQWEFQWNAIKAIRFNLDKIRNTLVELNKTMEDLQTK